MIWVCGAIAAIAGLYQVVAILACVWQMGKKEPGGRSQERGDGRQEAGVSILKPVRGVGPELERAIRSHLDQEYPAFELLIGVREDEAALVQVSDPRVRVVVCRTEAGNRKVGTLIDLAREARYPVLIVNDADISVPAGYIETVVSELAAPEVGLVTCLYRAESSSWAGRWEALGVSTDFAPSALVAPFVGVSEFGLGATLAFRREDLERLGGFEAIADYLADDYQLGCKLHHLGRRNVLAKPVVATTLTPRNWAAAWRHQVRWFRTVRLSRADGYLGLPVTFATFWAVVVALCGFPWLAAGVLVIRLLMAVVAGWFVVRSADVVKYLFLVPLRDLYTVAVWATALFGRHVEWGGETLALDGAGRIIGKSRPT